MPRQRNDTGGVLTAFELGRQIGPGEEVDSPLLVPGCTPADEDSAGDPPGDDDKPARHKPRTGTHAGGEQDKEDDR